MGFVSNQWLNRGQGLRNRRYNPVPVSIDCEEASDRWSRENDVVIEFAARRTNGEYQTLHLSQREAEDAGACIVAAMSEERREELLVTLLRGLSDVGLLRTLALGLTDRVRLPDNS
jgi:hypothetical protein